MRAKGGRLEEGHYLRERAAPGGHQILSEFQFFYFSQIIFLSSHVFSVFPISSSFFLRDVLEAKSEKTKIVWPKNDDRKRPNTNTDSKIAQI